MRIANIAGRLALLVGDGAADVESASNGRFSSDPQAIYDRWDEFRDWERTSVLTPTLTVEPQLVGAPVPMPRQVFAIGLNYSEHAAESGLPKPISHPPVFTKFPSSITGPFGDIRIPAGGQTDWEVELVVVVGRLAHNVASSSAWSHVAGLAVGQDISERVLQMASSPPQFSLGKSHPNFGPIGPCVVTSDEFDNPDDLELGCLINGEWMQKARTSDLIFPVGELIASLSAVLPLLPGDVIFTGTPPGVGMGRSPQRWLANGDVLVSFVTGIGEMRHHIIE